MPYSVRKRGDGWGVWNAGSGRWMAKKPQALPDAQAQCAALQASEHGDWKPSGKARRKYRRGAWRKRGG